MGDCTILVKKLGNDIAATHNTHNRYHLMLRLFKTTTIEWEQYKFMNTQTMRYSSRYGGIGSKDDFYILSSGLIAMETSILIYNNSLYDLIVPESVPYFIRVTVANWMAKDGRSWIDLFEKYDSGTHVAQWIIVDTNKKNYENETIMLLDSIMGQHESFDVTQGFLQKGYWGGYNVPYSQKIFETCGYDPVTHGYETDERAQIFNSTMDKIKNHEDIKHFIRKNDPIQHPCGGIAPRCDLALDGNRRAFGAIDGKYTQASWIRKGNFKYEVVNSPSYEENYFIPFAFIGDYTEVPHRSTPNVYNFTWTFI